MRPAHRLIVLTGLLLLAAGCCRPPEQEDRDNRRLLDAILTTITIKNTRLLDDNEKWAETRNEAGQLTDDDFHSMTAIIGKALRRRLVGS